MPIENWRPIGSSLLCNVYQVPRKTVLQTRKLREIWRILENPNPPTDTELAELLAFLDVVAMSGGILYDASTPPEDHEPFEEAAKALGLDVEAIPRATEEVFLADTKNAFGMASERIRATLNGTPDEGHARIPTASVAGFVKCVRDANAERDPDERLLLALEADGRNQRGAKLLAGAAQSDPNLLALLAAAFDRHDNAALMSSVINAFRPYLLATWAGRNGGVFVAGPDAIGHLTDHQHAFWWRMGG